MKISSPSIPTESDQTTQQPPAQPLAALVQQVRRDAVQDSQAYLDETTVPYGGE